MSAIPVSTEPKQQKQLQIIPLGDEMSYDFKRPHRHEYFEFFIFSEGGGSHFIDFVQYHIKPRCVHIVFPGQIHLLKRAGAKGLIIVCTKEFMSGMNKIFQSQLFQNNYSAPCVAFNDAVYTSIMQHVEAMQKELTTEKFLSSELVKSYMSIFLAQCLREFISLTAPQGKPVYTQQELLVFQQFSMLLDANFDDKPSVSFYASQLAMTPKTLNNCIKKITGKTCVDLIQERTLTEAKRLLLYTDKSSKEIAYELGFKDNSYFTRFFSKHTGHTPSSFKNYWEEKYHSQEEKYN